MFAKSTFALAALALVGSISAASAYEDPAYRIGDRYPVLAQGFTTKKAISTPVAYEDPAGLSWRYLPATVGTPAVRPLPRMAYEQPEYRIADRYPTLEPASTFATRMAGKPHRVFAALHRTVR